MRLYHQSTRIFIFFLFCAAGISGCSAKGGLTADYASERAPAQSAGGASARGYDYAVMEAANGEESRNGFNDRLPQGPRNGENTPAGAVGPERKLVRRAAVHIRVQDPEKAEKAVTETMEKYGAYASSATINEDSRYFTIRVPAASYQALLAGIAGLGRVLYRSESAEDVTVRYYDLEGRLATKRELLKTFQSYLGKAKNIEEILSVEERIAELEDEIDGAGRELRALGNMVDYATVDLEVYGPVTASSRSTPTLGERLLELFESFGGFASALALALVGIVIFGIPVVLILTVLFWLLFGKIGLLKKLWRAAAGKKAA